MDINTLDAINTQFNHDQAPSLPQSQQPKKPVNTGTWLPAEDARLRNAVVKHGCKWASVASDVETRNGDQCAKRWKENLNPELDHGPWTEQEEQHLLESVETYGRNWKFLANNFLESRAPLALKNRHALLMRRRFKRQDAGQAQQTTPAKANTVEAPLTYISKPPHALVGSSSSPSPTSEVDLMGFFGGGDGEILGNRPDHVALGSLAPAHGPQLPGVAGRTHNSVGDANSAPTTMRRGGGDATRRKMTTAAWDDRTATVWHQHPVMGDGSGLDSLLCSSGTASGGRDDTDSMAMISDSASAGDGGKAPWVSSSKPFGQQKQPGWGAASSLTSTNGTLDTDATAIEYTVTCTRSRLKPLSDHLMAAAIFEISGRATEDDQVTMTLRLNS